MSLSDKKIRKFVWVVFNKLNLGWVIQLKLKSALKEDGWIRSFKTKTSIDSGGRPIPWNSYSFIKFIEKRLKKDFQVFEYGSGNSTLWYAERVHHIAAVEHNAEWYNEIKNKMPHNVLLVYKDLVYGGDYSKESARHNKKFNIIIVDGRDRINCIKNSVDYLTNDGIIIFDNSDQPEYDEGINYLLDKGFRRLDFISMLPVLPHNNCTSVFYRQNNCLDI